MLFGMTRDQTEADFGSSGLGTVDAVLVANDISVSRAPDGQVALSNAAS